MSVCPGCPTTVRSFRPLIHTLPTDHLPLHMPYLCSLHRLTSGNTGSLCCRKSSSVHVHRWRTFSQFHCMRRSARDCVYYLFVSYFRQKYCLRPEPMDSRLKINKYIKTQLCCLLDTSCETNTCIYLIFAQNRICIHGVIYSQHSPLCVLYLRRGYK